MMLDKELKIYRKREREISSKQASLRILNLDLLYVCVFKSLKPALSILACIWGDCNARDLLILPKNK